MSNYQADKFYNNIAKRYHWFFSSWDDVMDKKMKELVPLLKKYSVKSILDCACGTGLQSIGLAKAGFRVVGSDLSLEMIKVAKTNAQEEGINDIEFFQSDFRELRNNIKKSFDAVICMGNSIPHLLSTRDILDALRNMYDSIKDGGLAVFDMRNYDKMLLDKQRFLPMRINAEKDGKIVSVLYVFDYLEDVIRFNIIYLIEDKTSGEKRMEVEVVDYNPIRSEAFIDLLKKAGFIKISKREVEGSLEYIAFKPIE